MTAGPILRARSGFSIDASMVGPLGATAAVSAFGATAAAFVFFSDFFASAGFCCAAEKTTVIINKQERSAVLRMRTSFNGVKTLVPKHFSGNGTNDTAASAASQRWKAHRPRGFTHS